MWDYLTKAFLNDIPGFGLRRADPSGTNFRNFADKYGGTSYDDLPAITAQMVDYMRNQNLSDGNLSEGESLCPELRLRPGHPDLLLRRHEEHAATWFIASSPSPKGVGPLYHRERSGAGRRLARENDRWGGNPTPVSIPSGQPQPGGQSRRRPGWISTRSKSGCWSRPSPAPKAGANTGRRHLHTRRVQRPSDPSSTIPTPRPAPRSAASGKWNCAANSSSTTASATPRRATRSPAPSEGMDRMGRHRRSSRHPANDHLQTDPLPRPRRAAASTVQFFGHDRLRPTISASLSMISAAGPTPPRMSTHNLIQFIPLAFPENNGGYPLPTGNPSHSGVYR